MVLKELGRDLYITVHESAIEEIIEPEKTKHTITISEETYQSIKGQLEKDEQ